MAPSPNGIGKPSDFHIPTIDISPYVADSSFEAAALTVADVRQACITTGFFQLTGHGISPELQGRVIKAAERLFALPLEEKKSLVPQKGELKNRGYEILGSQALQGGTLPDLKEGYFIGRHIPASDDRARSHPLLMGENIFPASISDEVLKQPTEEYYEAVFQLSLKVLEILAKGLPYGDDVFADFVSNDPYCSLRLLHYPPQRSQDERQLGAGAHTDFGAITLLYQPTHGGLEVLNPSTQQWVAIPPNDAAYVVNVGDMLSLWTRGAYKSSVHRVINSGGTDRYSVPFFFDGNLDMRLTPLDGGEAIGGRVPTVEQHMLERLGLTYGRVEKGEAV